MYFKEIKTKKDSLWYLFVHFPFSVLFIPSGRPSLSGVLSFGWRTSFSVSYRLGLVTTHLFSTYLTFVFTSPSFFKDTLLGVKFSFFPFRTSEIQLHCLWPPLLRNLSSFMQCAFPLEAFKMSSSWFSTFLPCASVYLCVFILLWDSLSFLNL